MSFVAQEQAAFDQEVAKVKQWFQIDRFARVSRPYTAEDVVRKRGSINETYASNEQAKKLWSLLKEHKVSNYYHRQITLLLLPTVPWIQFKSYRWANT
jgi:isocitrate lyase